MGNGIMGMIPGLIAASIVSYKDVPTIVKAEILVVVGAVVGMLIPALLEIPLSGIDFMTAITGYWFPAAISDIINGLVLVPILMVAYDAVAARSGR